MERIYHPPELWLQTVPAGPLTSVRITGTDDRTRQGALAVTVRQREQVYAVEIKYALPHERAAESFTDLLGSLADALAASYRVARVPTGNRETAYGFFFRSGLRATAALPIFDEHYRCADRLLHVLPTLNRPDVTLGYASGARAPRVTAQKVSGRSS
jgi:hypothetical protein